MARIAGPTRCRVTQMRTPTRDVIQDRLALASWCAGRGCDGPSCRTGPPRLADGRAPTGERLQRSADALNGSASVLAVCRSYRTLAVECIGMLPVTRAVRRQIAVRRRFGPTLAKRKSTTARCGVTTLPHK